MSKQRPTLGEQLRPKPEQIYQQEKNLVDRQHQFQANTKKSQDNKVEVLGDNDS